MNALGSAGFVIVVVATLATSTRAQPASPSKLVAIPNYDSVTIEISWQDNSINERGFEIFRNTDGGGFVSIGTVGQNVKKFNDVLVTDTSEYVYAVSSFNNIGHSAFSDQVAQNVKVLWPVPVSHEILHNWNDTIGDAGVGENGAEVGFHKGVDIQRKGNNNDVVAARGGVVAHAGDGPNGAVIIKVKIGPNKFEVENYNHLAAGIAVSQGDVVKAGDKLGQIDQSGHFKHSSGAVTHFVEHVHFNQNKTLFGVSVGRHPLVQFSANGDLDPQEKKPSLMDHPGSPPGTALFRRQGAPTGAYLPFDDTHPLSGDIDVIVEVVDEMGTNPEQVPTFLGYWIEPVATPSCIVPSGVKSTGSAYRLFDFASTYFGTGQSNMDLSKRIADEGQKDGPLIVDGSETYPWPHFYHFIVTNAGGTTGVPGDVDENQHWNTNAKNDGADAGVAHANYAGKPDTTIVTEARFPDGNYTVHIEAGDLISAADLTQVVRLENFPPIVCDAQPTGQLPEGTTATTCSVVFNEAMDVAIDPLSLVSVDSGAIVGAAQWSDDVTLSFDILGLVSSKTYAVTVRHDARDLPGTPGGNELDGNQDGIAGDDFVFTFGTFGVITDPFDVCNLKFNNGAATIVFASQAACEAHSASIPTTSGVAGKAQGSSSVSDTPKEIKVAARAAVQPPTGTEFFISEVDVSALHSHETTFYFSSSELAVGEEVDVRFGVSMVATITAQLGSGPGTVNAGALISGNGWAECFGSVFKTPQGTSGTPFSSSAEGSMLLKNGVGVTISTSLQANADAQTFASSSVGSVGEAKATCTWLGVISATSHSGMPITEFTLVDGCGVNWVTP